MGKVKKNYRIREDVAAELDGLVVLVNMDLPEGEPAVKETYLVECAITAFVQKIKRGMCARASLVAKSPELKLFCDKEAERALKEV